MNLNKALIVDSDAERAALARRILQQAGYQAETAGDGWSALVRLQQAPPDLLLIRPQLSIVSGYEVARYARMDQRLAGMRILMLGEASLSGPALELADAVVDLPLAAAPLLRAVTGESLPRTVARPQGQFSAVSPNLPN